MRSTMGHQPFLRAFDFVTFWMLLIVSTTLVYAASPGNVVFNELMWTGSFASSADEWIELRNTTDEAIDLSGWTITRLSEGEEKLMLTIEQGTIPPNGLFLIANYGPEHENSHLAVASDLISTAVSLSNSKLQIKLYDGPWDGDATLIDTADDGIGAPAAGDNEAKCAMVRKDPVQDGAVASSWYTAEIRSGWDPDTTEVGTPGFSNDGGDAAVRDSCWGDIKSDH